MLFRSEQEDSQQWCAGSPSEESHAFSFQTPGRRRGDQRRDTLQKGTRRYSASGRGCNPIHLCSIRRRRRLGNGGASAFGVIGIAIILGALLAPALWRKEAIAPIVEAARLGTIPKAGDRLKLCARTSPPPVRAKAPERYTKRSFHNHCTGQGLMRSYRN